MEFRLSTAIIGPERPIAQGVEVEAPGAAIKSTYLGNEFQFY